MGEGDGPQEGSEEVDVSSVLQRWSRMLPADVRGLAPQTGSEVFRNASFHLLNSHKLSSWIYYNDLLVENTSGRCRKPRSLDGTFRLRERCGQTVCELSVEKEANNSMHFPLMENGSVVQRPAQPPAANKTSKGCFNTDPTAASPGKIIYLQTHFYVYVCR